MLPSCVRNTHCYQAVQDEVEGLVSATKATDVKLHNAVNEFLLLSNLQFVENVSTSPLETCRGRAVHVCTDAASPVGAQWRVMHGTA